MAREVTLEADGGPSITVRFPGMQYLGLWHWPKTDAPYVCIEPWCNAPDYVDTDMQIAHKPGMIRLAPGDSVLKAHTVTFL